MKRLKITSLAVGFLFAAAAWAGAGDKIHVADEAGRALAGADVLVGEAPGNPFAGNTLKTDANGDIVVPRQWTTPLPVTVRAAGFMTATYLALKPTKAELQLQPADAANKIEIKGQTINFGSLKRDGKIDFALVYPALKRRQLAQFNVSSLISQEYDQMKVFTETVNLPSNITLPKQKESYVLPLIFEKPEYRMYLNQPGDYRMMATHGQFPLQQVVDELRGGKSIFDVMNYFKFLGGGQRDVSIAGAMDNLDVPVDQLNFDKAMTVTSPTLLANQTVVSAALAEKDGLFFPSDLKRLQSSASATLQTVSSSKNYIVSLLMETSSLTSGTNSNNDGTVSADPVKALAFLLNTFTQPSHNQFFSLDAEPTGTTSGLSIALHDETAPIPVFLNLVSPPTLSGQTLSLTPPAAVAGLDSVATYAVLSEIETVTTASGKQVERRTRLQEVYQMGWVNQLTIPSGAMSNLDPKKGHKWDVLFLARRSGASMGGYFLDEVTHITRNSVSF